MLGRIFFEMLNIYLLRFVYQYYKDHSVSDLGVGHEVLAEYQF